ncbi:tyrosine-protein phosphatase [Winogradskyella eckloniae]|uniref:phosphatase domain-containing putative toxin n=1 Tax=Winogradskyella eckloniae TaxID=1089306 RepID=UPI00156657D3|nr:tyrosine-protein phosphatase [Winogradskyella eckloniae]NRD20368.1 tyrosine-protein phosphatase [Winogradskyella eckloniae]
MHKLIYFSMLFVTLGYAQCGDNEKHGDCYKEIDSNFFDNLYQINDSIYRSEQPNKQGFKELESSGVKTIVNLRRLRNDNKKAVNTDLQLEHIPLATKYVTEDDIIEVLQVMNSAEKPLLVHCWHGSDRTGVIIASYRIIFENWTKEDAINEFKIREFGYHKKKYPNLISLLENLDIENIKKELKLD